MPKQRVITAAVCLPILLLLLWLNGWWLGIALLILAVIGCYEYLLLEARTSGGNWRWRFGGLLYILIGFAAFFGVRQLGGMAWLLTVIWVTDTVAYELGRRWGKHKLAPTISPNKTWEGALGGAAGGLLAGTVCALMQHHCGLGTALLVSLFISAVGQTGDLLESFIKRRAGVKDSGKLLPGHGGILDRFDSLLLASMFMYVIMWWLTR